MRIISTVMLSKQTQNNCSLRSTAALQEQQVPWAGNRSGSWVEMPGHPPGFNYGPALGLWFPKFWANRSSCRPQNQLQWADEYRVQLNSSETRVQKSLP